MLLKNQRAQRWIVNVVGELGKSRGARGNALKHVQAGRPGNAGLNQELGVQNGTLDNEIPELLRRQEQSGIEPVKMCSQRV